LLSFACIGALKENNNTDTIARTRNFRIAASV